MCNSDTQIHGNESCILFSTHFNQHDSKRKHLKQASKLPYNSRKKDDGLNAQFFSVEYTAKDIIQTITNRIKDNGTPILKSRVQVNKRKNNKRDHVGSRTTIPRRRIVWSDFEVEGARVPWKVELRYKKHREISTTKGG